MKTIIKIFSYPSFVLVTSLLSSLPAFAGGGGGGGGGGSGASVSYLNPALQIALVVIIGLIVLKKSK